MRIKHHLFLTFLMSSSLAFANWTETGKVIYVDDGDTTGLLRDDMSKVKIRLSSVDAPETAHGKTRPGQPFSKKAKDFLHSKVHGQRVVANCFEKDKYERPVCDIQIDGVSINAQLVENGLAWVNTSQKRYVRDISLVATESAARSKKIGIWSHAQAIPPWQWRKQCWEFKICESKSE